ncbi:hypothetical protein IW261DRAFT_1467362 [Armillaria novae-zelandiae]|uniref:F-box domain-containing protein n=1 Tax=Armillaria novae-zelandiae TaxID=153914 RepID=A0AA39PDN8_9AGAR|nr:hypothetical protein IW261DRAFT_1467362 [Armillaria novae-zelandiae]
MSCVTCNNCGFVNFFPSESQLQTLAVIQNSDTFVLQLLRGSQPLLDNDFALISHEIVELERLRSVYDAQLQGLESRRYPVLKSLENRKSIYAPIRRIPRDILLEIFHSVCDIWRKDSLNLYGPLWVLGRVCRVWRDTLHTSPASWSRNVLIESPFSNHAPQILRTYLKRTGDHPLSIQIIDLSTKPSEDGEIMPLLFQSCYRWKNLRIRIGIRQAHHLKSIFPLPLLQTVEVHIIDDDFNIYSSDMCLNAPQLRQATFISHGIHQMRLSPSCLTRYSGPVTCAEDLLLLSQLPMLKMCHIIDIMIDLIDMPRVVMIELRQLYVGSIDVLEFLTAPTLQSLDIARSYHRSVPTITRFLHRSGCQLESLSMRMEIFESEPSALISEMLSSEVCSTISRLKLQLDSQLVKVANTLTPASVLPNLHRLVLCIKTETSLGGQTDRLVNMVRSRHDAGLLKTVEVQFGIRCDDDYYGEADEHFDADDDRALTESHDIEARIRALIDENLDMRVDRWNPVDLDLRLFFWDGEIVY